VTPRAVRVVTEVAAVDRPFDYALDESTEKVGLGDRVRVDFNHRSVRGWVVEDVEPSDGLKTVKKWLGFGPPPNMLELLRWASERWYGTWSRFLHAASPTRLVTILPAPPAPAALTPLVLASALRIDPGVIQLAPTSDPLGLVLGAYEATRERTGSLLVLAPTEGWSKRLRGRLEQRGCAVASADEWDRLRAGWPVAVGARGTALAPLARLCGAVILDADDEAYVSSAAPTWNALDVVRERCRRDGAPLWCTSMLPSPVLLDRGDYVKGEDLVGGWPRVGVVDRRQGDPHDGVLSPVALAAAHRALEGDEPVAVVVLHQRLGTGRLLACARCGELTRCAICQQAEVEVGDQLVCVEGHETRPRFCRSCGSTNLRRLKVGVTTLARDVSAQLGRPVSEVTAAGERDASLERVVVGTEAIWQHVRRAGVVVFADFDQYLLAPRSSARRAAVEAVGKAGRLVGSRRDARGEVVLQTRRSEDPVVRALVDARFDDLIDDDVATAELLGLAPYGAAAEVSGEGAAAFVAQLTSLSVSETPSGYEVRASDAATLSSALREAARPAQKVRVAVH
jgi:primosomal protein N'